MYVFTNLARSHARVPCPRPFNLCKIQDSKCSPNTSSLLCIGIMCYSRSWWRLHRQHGRENMENQHKGCLFHLWGNLRDDDEACDEAGA